MSGRVHANVKVPSGPAPSFAPVQSGLLQRKSLLGGAPGLAGEFTDSRRKRLVSQPPLVQAKLTINQQNDRYEQEADRVADEVMRMPEPLVQRQVEPEEEEEEILQTKPLAAQITPLIQRQIEPEEEEEEEELIRAKETSGQTPHVSPILQTQIHSLRGGGQPLSPPLRNFFEPRFGHDFSRVRLHTDERAAESARAVNARAFTIGPDVVFGAGQYAPETTKGKRLLAHELTHVMQQNGHRGGFSTKLKLQRAVRFKADFENISLKKGTGATISGNSFYYADAKFAADAKVVATGNSVAELNQWDVGVLQDITPQWDRYYWRRTNTDRRGKFVERKFIPIYTRFRDQASGASTVWSADSEHQLLSGLAAVLKGSRFQVSTTIKTSDDPDGSEPIDGSAAPGMDASDGTSNINIQRIGSRFDTWISAHNTVTGTWRHIRRLNWNYQRSLDFKGRGATLAVRSEKWKLGKHGPYGAGKKAPLTTGTTANSAVAGNANWSFGRVAGWT